MKEAVRTFFYQRSGFAKQAPYADSRWTDGASHLGAGQDLDCRLVTDPNNAATSKDLSGGWYDAGDYNKYVTFTFSPMHDLLAAYERNPAIWGDDFNIPESGNGIPDLLDELRWELDWLMKMQLDDGSALAKVSVTDFSAASPPSADNNPRFYGPATASSTRTVCSIFAHAALVMKSVGEASLETYADTLEARAIKAWNWIVANPATSTYDNAGFSSATPEQSAYWQEAVRTTAAVYLFELTGQNSYRDYFDNNYTNFQPYQWTYWYPFEPVFQDAMLYYTRLPNATASVVQNIQANAISSATANNSDMLPAYQNGDDAYRAYLGDQNYVWGSNMVKAESGGILMSMNVYGLDTTNQVDYRDAAAGYIHYLHGVNPGAFVFLTNMGDYGAENSVNQMYHGWFGDGTDFDHAVNSPKGPASGYLTGGANPSFSPSQGYLAPPQGQPIQKSYKDWNTSWPEDSWEITEPAIYYQGAYIKLLSAFVEEGEGGATPVEELETSLGMQVFPNPASHRIQVGLDIKTPLKGQLQILSLLGEVVLEKKVDLPVSAGPISLEVEDLAPGVYLAVWQGNSQRGFVKWVKK
ncbi:MAG: glycoside hydrolase family 9 protein [Bacteroidota bacterium]